MRQPGARPANIVSDPRAEVPCSERNCGQASRARAAKLFAPLPRTPPGRPAQLVAARPTHPRPAHSTAHAAQPAAGSTWSGTHALRRTGAQHPHLRRRRTTPATACEQIRARAAAALVQHALVTASGTTFATAAARRELLQPRQRSSRACRGVCHRRGAPSPPHGGAVRRRGCKRTHQLHLWCSQREHPRGCAAAPARCRKRVRHRARRHAGSELSAVLCTSSFFLVMPAQRRVARRQRAQPPRGQLQRPPLPGVYRPPSGLS